MSIQRSNTTMWDVWIRSFRTASPSIMHQSKHFLLQFSFLNIQNVVAMYRSSCLPLKIFPHSQNLFSFCLIQVVKYFVQTSEPVPYRLQWLESRLIVYLEVLKVPLSILHLTHPTLIACYFIVTDTLLACA